MTSDATFPQRLTKVDDLIRPDHSHLVATDSCYFIGEYSARKGFAFSPTNGLIINFKKKPDRKHLPEWKYKGKAIVAAGKAFGKAIPPEFLNKATLVPMPPSKAKDDPLHDDRMLRMLAWIKPGQPLDIRELLLQNVSTEAAHENNLNRPRPEDLIPRYHVDPALREPAPTTIALFDDVLTTGAHFKAGQAVLHAAFPQARIVGLFIARRVPEADDFEVVWDL